MVSNIIVTLGPEGTCSDIVLHDNLHRFATQCAVQLLPTYEAALTAVEQDRALAALVAAAYPRFNELVMRLSRSVVITDAFVHKTPPLVIASKEWSVAPDVDPPVSVACMIALTPLLRAWRPGYNIVTASSNTNAADMVVDGITVAAVTNEPAALARGLRVIHSFGDLPMAWIVLSKKPVTLTADKW